MTTMSLHSVMEMSSVKGRYNMVSRVVRVFATDHTHILALGYVVCVVIITYSILLYATTIRFKSKLNGIRIIRYDLS
jgi:hypothetical protein